MKPLSTLGSSKLRWLLLLGVMGVGAGSFDGIGSAHSSSISARIEALPEEAYVGGMPSAVAEIAAEIRDQMQGRTGAELPACELPDSLQGAVVATSIGLTPPSSAVQPDPALRELQVLLASERRFVRDAGAFLIGEIGPAARPLEPDLSGDDVGRSVWFSHALGRISCQRYSLGTSLDLIPAAVTTRVLGDPSTGHSLRSSVQLIAALVSYPDLIWPDEFFSSAIEQQDIEREHVMEQPIEAAWIHTIADRMIDESAPMRLRLDLASLMHLLGHAAWPAAEKMWDLTQHADEELAARVALALVHTGSDRAVDAAAILLTRFDAAVFVLPDELCEMERATVVLQPLLRAWLVGDDWKDAMEAVEKLGCMDPIGSADVLRSALEHPSWEVQLAAIGALAESAGTDPDSREALAAIQRDHWSGLLRQEVENILNPRPPVENDPGAMDTISLRCFHRCLNDHLRRCGDDHGIVDGLYVSPTMGELDIEWERARRVPRPDGFPVAVKEDSRPHYGTSTYLRVEDGWLYATDRWHYDGEVSFVDDHGEKVSIGGWGEDAAAIIETPHFGRVLLGRSLFRVGYAGLLASLERGPDGWRMQPRVALPSPPWGWAFAPNGTLLVADPYEAVAVLADGRIESLACPARPPSHPVRSLLAVAKRAPTSPSERKHRELVDAVAVRESELAAKRNRLAELTENPGKGEQWERPDLLRAWLQNDLRDLVETYLIAGRAEAGLAMIAELPDDLVDIGPGQRIQLYAATGRLREARAELAAAANSDDKSALKMQTALALAERRPEDARAALRRIESLHSQNSVGNQAADPFLEILQRLADTESSNSGWSLTGDDEWPGPIHAYLAGTITEKDLAMASHRRDGQVDREKLCEALFYNGLKLALEGKPRAARAHFRAVTDLSVEHYLEHSVAAVLLRK